MVNEDKLNSDVKPVRSYTHPPQPPKPKPTVLSKVKSGVRSAGETVKKAGSAIKREVKGAVTDFKKIKNPTGGREFASSPKQAVGEYKHMGKELVKQVKSGNKVGWKTQAQKMSDPNPDIPKARYSESPCKGPKNASPM